MVQAVALNTLHIGRKPGKMSADGKSVVTPAEVDVVPPGAIVDLDKKDFNAFEAAGAVRLATKMDRALADAGDEGGSQDGETPNFDGMTRDEINAYAAKQGLGVSGAANKDEAIALIKAAG